MGLRGCASALVVLTWIACKGDDKTPDPSPQPTTTIDLDKRCIQLGKICGDKGKHVDKIVDECKLEAKKQLDKGCADKVNAAYDCYERELCGKSEKVWAIEDLGVLAERHGKCVTERNAVRDCVGK